MRPCVLSSMRGVLAGKPLRGRSLILRFCSTAFMTAAASRLSYGNPTTFALDPTRSSFKLTGVLGAGTLGTQNLISQEGGSDNATYSGSLLANLSVSGIQFPGGSSAVAGNYVGGVLMPDNPANYGMKAVFSLGTEFVTVKNLGFDFTSGSLTVAADGAFAANSGFTATATSGVVDDSGFQSGTTSFVGRSASNQSTPASISISGQTQTLTIPIQATFAFTSTTSLTFTGQLVATATISTPAIAYWQGTTDGNWSTISPTAATNWRTDASGANDTQGLPGSISDVFFTTSDHGSDLSTTLGANYSIKGLTFTSDAINSTSIGGANTLTLGADGLTVQNGSAAAAINCPVVLGASQSWAINNSSPLAINGSFALASFALTKSGSGTLEIDGGISLGNNSSLAVSGGKLRLNINSGSASVGTGVSANITSSGVLELAGSVSALGTATPANRVAITNSSNTAAGLLVSAGNQQVGGIGGTGITQVNTGASLTANHIIQNARRDRRHGGQPRPRDDRRQRHRRESAGSVERLRAG